MHPAASSSHGAGLTARFGVATRARPRVLRRPWSERGHGSASSATTTRASIRRSPASSAGLLALLKGFPGRKASILRALGACRALQAGPVIQKELGGDDVAAAAKALGQIPYPKAYATLLGMLKRDPDIDFSRPSVVNEMAFLTRRAAIVGLAYFGKPDPKAIGEFVTIIEDAEDDYRLRRQAGQTLGLIADDALRATILQKITDANLIATRTITTTSSRMACSNPDRCGGAFVLPRSSGTATTRLPIPTLGWASRVAWRRAGTGPRRLVRAGHTRAHIRDPDVFGRS